MKHASALLFLLSFTACGHLGSSSSSAPQTYQKASDIPVEEFFRNPAAVAYRISPDGTQLAMFKAWKNRLNVFISPTGKPGAEKQLTFIADRDLANLWWKGNDYIVFQKDAGGDENFHIYSVNVKNGEVRDLTPLEKTRAELVDDLDEISADEILVQHNHRDKRYFDVYRLNVRTGESKMVAENKQKISGWLVDHEGNVRGGVADDGLNEVFYFRKDGHQPFKEIFKTGFRNNYSPFAFTSDNHNLFVSTNLNSDLQRIVEVDPAHPTKFLRVLYSPEHYDVGGAEYSKVRKTVNMVSMTTDRSKTFFLNPEDQKDWETLSARFPKMVLDMAGHSRDERHWVVRASSDLSRGAYYLYDRNSQTATKLDDISPWLPENLMSEMRTVHFKSRDGLNLEGYLTVPRGVEAKSLPVIINPHGGPWARDVWRFNPEVQFLASRGYAVLQVNFRGSTGYGRKFWEASFKQWGRKMQNDVSDSVKWLVSEGIADSKKVCIYGGSYGGYVTLAGITLTPDLYTCAVDYVGVANLLTFMKTIPPYWESGREMMYKMIGDPVKEKAMMMEVSPVFHADKVRAALFIAQGANDPRVNKNESDQMVEAMRKHGVNVEYMVKSNEGHGFHNEENRFDFYRAMEKFLAKHLGGQK